MDEMLFIVGIVCSSIAFCIGWFGALFVMAYCEVMEQERKWEKIG